MQMDPQIITAVVSGIGAISAALVGSIKMLSKRVDKMLSELRPNGGSSMKDKIDKLEARIDDLYHLLIVKDGKQ